MRGLRRGRLEVALLAVVVLGCSGADTIDLLPGSPLDAPKASAVKACVPPPPAPPRPAASAPPMMPGMPMPSAPDLACDSGPCPPPRHACSDAGAPLADAAERAR